MIRLFSMFPPWRQRGARAHLWDVDRFPRQWRWPCRQADVCAVRAAAARVEFERTVALTS